MVVGAGIDGATRSGYFVAYTLFRYAKKRRETKDKRRGYTKLLSLSNKFFVRQVFYVFFVCLKFYTYICISELSNFGQNPSPEFFGGGILGFKTLNNSNLQGRN